MWQIRNIFAHPSLWLCLSLFILFLLLLLFLLRLLFLLLCMQLSPSRLLLRPFVNPFTTVSPVIMQLGAQLYVSLFFAKFQGQKVHFDFIYFDCTCIYANSSMKKRFCLNVILYLNQEIDSLCKLFIDRFCLVVPYSCFHMGLSSILEFPLKDVKFVNTQPELVGLLKLFVQIKRTFLLPLVDNDNSRQVFSVLHKRKTSIQHFILYFKIIFRSTLFS